MKPLYLYPLPGGTDIELIEFQGNIKLQIGMEWVELDPQDAAEMRDWLSRWLEFSERK